MTLPETGLRSRKLPSLSIQFLPRNLITLDFLMEQKPALKRFQMKRKKSNMISPSFRLMRASMFTHLYLHTTWFFLFSFVMCSR